jgi:hypothetical protein
MRASITRGLIVVMSLATLSLPACSSRSDLPELAPVRGTVTMQGKPMSGVGVTFFPMGKGPIATGNTNAEGQFVLMTSEPGDGASVGSHRVSLGSAEEGRRPSMAIPEKYDRPDSSGLTAEVKAGEENNFTFDLTP